MARIRMSVSQLNATRTCGHQWVLEKVHKVPGKPHMGAIAGSVFHKITEMEDYHEHGMDVGEIPEVEDLLEGEISKALHDTPYEESDIRVSRSLPKGYSKADWPNGQDRAFFKEVIPIWLHSYRAWRRSIPYDLWMYPDPEFGTPTPAIEVEVRGTFGDVDVLGYIDRVYEHRVTKALVPGDLKSGQRAQSSNLQLGSYASFLEQTFPGIERPRWGFFYDARQGVSGEFQDLSEWTDERLAYEFNVAAKQIEHRLLGPNYESCEYMCSVRDYCHFRQGRYAGEVPLPWEGAVDLGMPTVREEEE